MTLVPHFYFEELHEISADFNNFWYTTSWRNLSLENYELNHPSYKQLMCCVAKCKNDFKQDSTFRLNSWLQNLKHSRDIPHHKTVQTANAQSSLTEQKHEVCTCHCLINSSTMCCWNAVRLWNRYCCDCGRMRLLWTLTVT